MTDRECLQQILGICGGEYGKLAAIRFLVEQQLDEPPGETDIEKRLRVLESIVTSRSYQISEELELISTEPEQ